MPCSLCTLCSHCAQKKAKKSTRRRKYYDENFPRERAMARQRAQETRALEDEEQKQLRKQRRKEQDAKYREEHRELLRAKAAQYRHTRKLQKEIKADESEFQRLMSLDFDSVVDSSSSLSSTYDPNVDSSSSASSSYDSISFE
ncbi:hypothetical protein CVT26_013502 [Gymnopilus dilepis]|uniref:Uncharacterized protein n=1 Tax=Gymnopilus dilepis TaxID=231916 RepID=A0A409Y5J6_9AGAR|nr:hypothetical protein CVT26_013502 [Gymnopilus dilepis]